MIIKTEEECLIIRSYVGVVAFIIYFLHRGYFHQVEVIFQLKIIKNQFI